jgi:hypothetical protein
VEFAEGIGFPARAVIVTAALDGEPDPAVSQRLRSG